MPEFPVENNELPLFTGAGKISGNGETDLEKLLSNMQPIADEREFVFCTADKAAYDRLAILPLGFFREAEGISLILEKSEADGMAFSYDDIWTLITLNVHSALSAVGFLAAITTRLAEAGISVNSVSAYYHDHLFVPFSKREKVLMALREFATKSDL